MIQQPEFVRPSSEYWGKADLHIHTHLSDGGPSPERVVEHVAHHTDLDVIAVTDHNRIAGGLRARDHAERRGLALQVIVGEEVATADGHLLALFIDEPVAPGRPMEDSIAAVHEQGGLAVASHPFDMISSSLMGRGSRGWSLEELALLPLDGMEVLNGSLVQHVANARAALLAHSLGFTPTGSSDAHHLAVIGRAHTRFPGNTAEDLRRAILAGSAMPGGASWQWRNYLSWISGCLIPRTLRRTYYAVRALAPA